MIKFSKTNLNTNSEEKIPFTIKILQTLKLKTNTILRQTLSKNEKFLYIQIMIVNAKKNKKKNLPLVKEQQRMYS